jgi:Ca2+-binding RTX toxin-like protein
VKAHPFRLALLVVVIAVVAGSGLILTAGNSVPASHVGSKVDPISATDSRPSACALLGLTTRRTGSGTINGNNANELILGSSGTDRIAAGGGNDCVVGGGGSDSINGGGGTDVCIGGPNTDSFSNCEVVIQ